MFGSQHLNCGSQFSVAPVRKVLIASCGLHEHQAHMCYADINVHMHVCVYRKRCTKITHTHKIIIKTELDHSL